MAVDEIGAKSRVVTCDRHWRKQSLAASLGCIWAFARRESHRSARDRIRLAFALLGPLVLLVAFGFGISFDIENVTLCGAGSRPVLREPPAASSNFPAPAISSNEPPLYDEFEIDPPTAIGRAALRDRHSARLWARSCFKAGSRK